MAYRPTRADFTTARAGLSERERVMTEPTPYQLEKLLGMYKKNIAELAAIRAIAATGTRVPYVRIRRLKKAARAVERLERELGVNTAEHLPSADAEDLHKLQAPLQAANALEFTATECSQCGEETSPGATVCIFCADLNRGES